MMTTLTERQRREREYHQGHAALQSVAPMKYDILESRKRRWWNAYWDLWTYLITLDLKGKRILVVGCGSGDDAILFARLGAAVSAFDLSPDMLAIAKARALLSEVAVDFDEMASETLAFEDSTFDLIFARDILHHVDIPQTMQEIVRVAKQGALFIADEIYSHSITNRIRYSAFVEKWLYPRLRDIVYGGQKPYITADERKMTEHDIDLVRSHLALVSRTRYFNFLVTRIISDKNILLSKIDRAMLIAAGKSAARFLAGRIVLVGRIGP
jgi:ubiquinone/menaquinone biosynthesis C-methylase UbiE